MKRKKKIPPIFILAFLIIGLAIPYSQKMTSDPAYDNFMQYQGGWIHQNIVSFQAANQETAERIAQDNNLSIHVFLPALSKATGKYCGYYIRQKTNRKHILDIISGLAYCRGLLYAGPNPMTRVNAIPNDPDFSKLYGLHNTGQTGGKADADIDAPEAWDLTSGSKEVIVAVSDTGIYYTHEDLAENMWVNPDEIAGNNIDDDNNGYVDDIHGIDAINGSGNPMDENNHGSHCSGTIGGVGNNDKGVAGVCWTVKLMALKHMGAGATGDDADALVCMDYLIDQLDRGRKIVCSSNSWTADAYDKNLWDAIEAAGQKGCLFVAAAGNSSSNNDNTPVYPCGFDCDYIISVAATDHSDALASFSNYGAQTVDLGAPGNNIYSCNKSGGYMQMSGTSMACPHVSGACALIKSAFPSMGALEIKNLILDTTDPISALSGKCVSGGRLNVFNAINSGSMVKAAFHYEKINNRSFNFFDDSTVSNGTITHWQWNFGDGQSSTLKNPSHTYASDNYYTVSLAVTTNDNSTDTASKPVWAGPNQPPKADFAYTVGSQFNVTFTDKSTDDNQLVAWLWNFGDNTSSTETNPIHHYAAAGSYNVSLQVTDNNGGKDSISKTIFIPVIYCSSSAESSQPVAISKFGLGSFENSSGKTEYSDFTAKEINLATSQTYTMTIAMDSTFWTGYCRVWIDYNLNGDFSDSGEKVLEKSGAGTVSGTISIPATALTHKKLRCRLSMQYGSYRDACGSGGWGEVEDYTVILNGLINDPPIASFTFSTNQLTASFTDTSIDPDGQITAWLWNFGDSSTSTEQHPSHAYAIKGTYSVSLKVTDNQAASNQISKPVTVSNDNPLPCDHIIGSFPSADGIWKRDSNSGQWTNWSKKLANCIRTGDIDGNGLDDTAHFFAAEKKLWFRDDNGNWVDIPAKADSLICYDLGDMDNDQKADLVGSWDIGLWWRNTASQTWIKLSTMAPSFLACGDFNGDNKTDVVGLFPALKEIWIRYNNGSWVKISKQINISDLRCGDMNKDGKDEIIGSWDIGVWAMDVNSGIWTRHHAQTASQITAGDINGDGMLDIIGVWPSYPGLWMKAIGPNTWTKLSNLIPDTLDSGNL